MLRVSKKGVVICEPTDYLITDYDLRNKLRTSFLMPLFIALLKWVAPSIAKRISDPVYEKSGNFAYRISRREMQKVALGMNLNHISFKGINDHYIEGAEKENAKKKGPIKRKIKRFIKLQDILSNIDFLDYRITCVGLFSEELKVSTKKSLESEGWAIVDLPENTAVKVN